MSKKPAHVMRFQIPLAGIEPPIWRLIDVPETSSFWDLHVAIQDSMGWLDFHLHSFKPPRRHGRVKSRMGIPDAFDPALVKFDNPQKRFNIALLQPQSQGHLPPCQPMWAIAVV